MPLLKDITAVKSQLVRQNHSLFIAQRNPWTGHDRFSSKTKFLYESSQ